MNYLAHLYLSRPTPASRVGNLLGDFRRGQPASTFPLAVQAGLRNHMAVDAFTDHYPAVRAARRGFSARRRRFAGIALDVYFDHLLIRHWHRFCDTDLDDFVESAYGDLSQGAGLMPDAMKQRVEIMRRQDWLRAYGTMETVGLALDRMAARIRFPNDFSGVLEEIEDREAELDAVFLEFFPELCRHIELRGIESTVARS